MVSRRMPMLRWMGHRALSTAVIVSLIIVIANLLWVGSPERLTQMAAGSSDQHKQQTPNAADKHKPHFLSREWLTDDPVGFFTAALAVFTWALVVVSVVQIRSLVRAERLARSSLIASQRAW